MNNINEITLDGLGTYQFSMYIQENGKSYQLHTITRTFSDIGNPFSVTEKVIGIEGENT